MSVISNVCYFSTSSVNSNTGAVVELAKVGALLTLSLSDVGVELIGVNDDVYHWLLAIGKLKASLSSVYRFKRNYILYAN